MKKWLSFLGTILIISSSTTSVIACNYEEKPSSKNYERIEVSSVVKNINLGSFDKIPNSTELLKQIEQLNPELDTSQLEIISHQNQKVVLSVIPNSKIYFESTITLFYLLASLDIIINQTDLGIFSNIPTDQEIIMRIKDFNSNLDISQMLVSNITDFNATISVIPNSKIYGQGNLEVSYKIDNRNDLKEILQNINLKSFKTVPTNEQLLKRIEELNFGVNVSQLEIISHENQKVVISVIEKSKIYFESTITLFYVLDLRVILESHINNKFLGYFDKNPNNNELLIRIKELNSDVDITQLKIIIQENEKILLTVIEGSEVYYQTVIELNYFIKTYLTKIIKQTDLGSFKSVPTNEQLLKRIEELNFGVNVSQLEINIHNNQKILVNVIEGSEAYYQAVIELTYIIDSRIQLEENFQKFELGTYKKLLTEKEILNKIKEINPDVDITQIFVELGTIWIGGATISVIVDSKIYFPDSFKITFIIDNRVYLKEIINVTTLDNFLMIPNKTDILYRTLYLNQKWRTIINFEEIEQEWDLFEVSFVKKGEALITTVKDSPRYFLDSIKVSYGINQNIPKTNLHPEFEKIIKLNDFEFDKKIKEVFDLKDEFTDFMLFASLDFLFDKNEFDKIPELKKRLEEFGISKKEFLNSVNFFLVNYMLIAEVHLFKTYKFTKKEKITEIIGKYTTPLKKTEITNDTKLIIQNILDYYINLLSSLN